MRRWLNHLAKLYPERWRERYGREFGQLIEDVEPRWQDLWDISRGAAMMQLRPWSGSLKMAGALGLAGTLLAFGMSFASPSRYVASASVTTLAGNNPEAVRNLRAQMQNVLTRHSLAEIIQRANLDLYRSQRQREPLEDVVEGMRKDLRIEDEGSTVRISFQYPDRYKAQSVVNAMARKINPGVDKWSIAPASLPADPIPPDRWRFAAWGLAAGLGVGIILSAFRSRKRWTIVAGGCALAGCAAAFGASFLIPNHYTSRAMLRVSPVPKGDGTLVWMKALNDESLSDIIQRPGLQLYAEQRRHQSIESVIATMRKNLKVETPDANGAFRVTFTYPDRFKAQAAVNALLSKFKESEFVITERDLMEHPPKHGKDSCLGETGYAYITCITAPLGSDAPSFSALKHPRSTEILELLDAASLPARPNWPNHETIALLGGVAGLCLGFFLARRPPQRAACAETA